MRVLQMTPLNVDNHEWEVTIHSVHDQKFIGHVR
jgi:hypothetical protein